MLQQLALAMLSAEEAAEWRRAIEHAEAEGTSFIAQPKHCVVATKPYPTVGAHDGSH